MGCPRTDCVEKPFSRLFEKLGCLVGSCPVWFIIVPLLVSIALGGGLRFLEDCEDNDIESQFTPFNGVSKSTRNFVKEYFPSNDSMFSGQRLYNEGNYAVVLMSSTDKRNILTKAPFKEVVQLNNQVTSLSVEVRGRRVGFRNLCSSVNKDCVTSPILDIAENDPEKIEQTRVTFPLHTLHNKPVFLGSTLGGVNESRSSVQHAQAIKVFYFLKNVSGANEWLQAFHKVLSTERARSNVKVSHFTSLSRQEEVQKHTSDGLPLFSITYVLVIAFSILSCLRLDNVRNRLWVAFLGVLSAGLAVISSFGLLLYAGVPFVITVANSPFLILGIGVDDMFIMLANWQQTNVRDPVEKRMADTYKEAAMSITITTLTNVLGFYIGLMSDFPSIQAFCTYTSTAIIFCFIYNITFFGAFLALNGKREAANRHWLTCMKIPASRSEGDSKAYALCCTGGDYDRKTGSEKEQIFTHFFKSYYGPLITKPLSKACVILLYAAYLAGGIYGCLHLKQGIEMKHLAADDSYVIDYYDDEKKYFSDYGPNVMVVVAEDFPYWDESRRSQLDLCMENFNNLSFVRKELFASWLDSYSAFARNSKLDISREGVFQANLPAFFKLFPEFEADVNITNGRIAASRFFVQTVNIRNASMEITMINELTDTAQSCTAAKLLVFHPMFIYLDQYSVIVRSTIQNVGVTAMVMLVISLFLIPNPLCSLWVTFSIGSVITGVTGYMALWDVNLDSISMIVLVVCIGFTVDFSAHVSYAFVSSKKATANEKAIDALFSLGYPVLQGALSTIIGVVVLATSKQHIFRTFFKIMFLVMLFGLAHGIVFIPVFLTWLSCSSSKHKKGSGNEERKANAVMPDIVPYAIRSEIKSGAYDNHAFIDGNGCYWTQSVNTQQTHIYAIQIPNTWRVGTYDPDCP
ncbi:patched domain-containing protein 3-like [Salminus brasiliensis]|uniref:patched domain-containing protein 3-like n=1 Tax=Salminus brasiliensis TaxID=930266 RepID=UPI003B83A50B